MKIVNLTPHELKLHNEAGELVATIAPDGRAPRVNMTRVRVGEVGGVPMFRSEAGEITDLPEPEDGTVFVVSGLVRAAVNRPDLWQPGELLRDEAGRVVGAVGLSQ